MRKRAPPEDSHNDGAHDDEIAADAQRDEDTEPQQHQQHGPYVHNDVVQVVRTEGDMRVVYRNYGDGKPYVPYMKLADIGSFG